MKIIFLDIDGVLNNSIENYRTPGIQNIDELKRIIKETDAEIVLTSSWRYSYESAIRLLRTYNIKAPISTTQITKVLDRGNEIVLWLAEFSVWVDKYVIVDDDILDIENYPVQNIIKVDPVLGLTRKNGDDIIRILT